MLQPGDWVRAESGEVGNVVHTRRLTVFVVVRELSKEYRVLVYLEHQLTKVDSPEHEE